MRGLIPILLVGVLQGLLVLQLGLSRVPGAGAGAAEELRLTSDAVLTRRVAAGGRVVLEVQTTGLVDVVIYEPTGDTQELQLFREGGVPRTAKEFSSVLRVQYPLASLSGTDFLVRVRHRQPGVTTVRFHPGTQDEAMGRLRRGENLVRNGGTVDVREGLYSMPIYQLVPGTLVRVEVEQGTGSVALLKFRDYREVREGRVSLGSLCSPARCVGAGSGRNQLKFYVSDYDDLYVVATGPVRFRYEVVATPEVLNYISSCT